MSSGILGDRCVAVLSAGSCPGVKIWGRRCLCEASFIRGVTTVVKMSAQVSLRSIWEKYYSDAHALLYCIDASSPERLDDARNALERVRRLVRLPTSAPQAALGSCLSPQACLLCTHVTVCMAQCVRHPSAPGLHLSRQALQNRELEGAPLLILANKRDMSGREGACLCDLTCHRNSLARRPADSAPAAPQGWRWCSPPWGGWPRTGPSGPPA